VGTFTVSVVAVDRGTSGLPTGRASEQILFTVEPVAPPPLACVSPPPTPTGVQGTRVLRTTNIRWNTSSGATNYIVRAGTTATSSDLFLGDVGGATTVGTDNLDPAIPLFVSIAAANACGSSPPSAPLQVVAAGGLSPCAPDAQTMCVFDGRFTLRLSGQQAGGEPTPAEVTRRFNDGGGFGFLNTTQENLFVRVENRCSSTGTFVVTFSTASEGIPVSTAFDLIVADNEGSIQRTYRHAAGTQFVTFTDATSFNRCP
jgi:hypothetical protein